MRTSRNLLRTIPRLPRSWEMLAILTMTVLAGAAAAQEMKKEARGGYASVNGLKMYYEIHD